MLGLSARRAMGVAIMGMGIGCGSTTSGGSSTGGSSGVGASLTETGGTSTTSTGGSSSAGLGGSSTGGSADLDGASVDDVVDDGGHCDALEEQHTEEGFLHLNNCDPTTYLTNPPSSGNHYGIWALYQTYTQPIRDGFWVHSLEHGAIVITYNCPEGCADDVARIQAFIDSVPNDCASFPKRFILLPDPNLDVKFAASAWTWTLKASCFDRDAFAAFAAAHYNHGREDICGGGIDPTSACP
jgi:hypothetical protein